MPVYKFRNCLLNTAERLVIKDNQHVDLTTKTFDVLQFLVENPGRTLTKDEFMGEVWNGDFVEESNLPVHISRLRKVLGQETGVRFIETMQGIGYRFTAPVTRAPDADWQAATFRKLLDSPSGTCLRAENPIAIAVFPFENDTGSPDYEYLADGLTESVINALAPVPGLRVLARNTMFRFKRKSKEASEVAASLGVTQFLTGRVRVVREHVIVGVELSDANEDAQIWGANYNRLNENLFGLPEEIARQASQHVLIANQEFVFDPEISDAESYRLYLKGRYYVEKHSGIDAYKAIDFFKESLSRDRTNLYALAELLECYRVLYLYDYISYEDFLNAALPLVDSLDPKYSRTELFHIIHCDLKLLEWKFDEASEHCVRALSLNHNFIKARLRYSDILLMSRNFEEALNQLNAVITVDPLSTIIYKRIGRLFYMKGDYPNALAYLNDALELEPNSHEALALMGSVYLELGDYEAALVRFRRCFNIEALPAILAMMGVTYAKQKRITKATQVLQELEDQKEQCAAYNSTVALLHLALDDRDSTFKFLEKAFEQHEPDLRALNYDRRWVGLRGDPRFKGLVSRVGLPVFDD